MCLLKLANVFILVRQATEIHSRKHRQNRNLQETLGVEEKGRKRGLAGNFVGHITLFCHPQACDLE